MEWFINLLYQNPLLFFIILLAIISYIATFILVFLSISKKTKLGNKLKAFSYKIVLKRKVYEIKSIEDLYAKVIDYFKSKGYLSKEDSEGFLARIKILNSINNLEKRKIIKEIFNLYEAKIYGEKPIENEAEIVNNLLNAFLSKF